MRTCCRLQKRQERARRRPPRREAPASEQIIYYGTNALLRRAVTPELTDQRSTGAPRVSASLLTLDDVTVTRPVERLGSRAVTVVIARPAVRMATRRVCAAAVCGNINRRQ